jgi:hypothetical protein
MEPEAVDADASSSALSTSERNDRGKPETPHPSDAANLIIFSHAARGVAPPGEINICANPNVVIKLAASPVNVTAWSSIFRMLPLIVFSSRDEDPEEEESTPVTPAKRDASARHRKHRSSNLFLSLIFAVVSSNMSSVAPMFQSAHARVSGLNCFTIVSNSVSSAAEATNNLSISAWAEPVKVDTLSRNHSGQTARKFLSTREALSIVAQLPRTSFQFVSPGNGLSNNCLAEVTQSARPENSGLSRAAATTSSSTTPPFSQFGSLKLEAKYVSAALRRKFDRACKLCSKIGFKSGQTPLFKTPSLMSSPVVARNACAHLCAALGDSPNPDVALKLPSTATWKAIPTSTFWKSLLPNKDKKRILEHNMLYNTLIPRPNKQSNMM